MENKIKKKEKKSHLQYIFADLLRIYVFYFINTAAHVQYDSRKPISRTLSVYFSDLS